MLEIGGSGYWRNTPTLPATRRTAAKARLLRRPVARSTCDALLPEATEPQRDAVASGVLDWIDALAPVIAAARAPRRWSRARRDERTARLRLEDLLAPLPGLAGTPQQAATMLAAGIQVPIAAGAWLLAWLGSHPTHEVDPVGAVWETLRLTPPTWITARLALVDVQLDGERVPSGSVVLVSPLLLGHVTSSRCDPAAAAPAPGGSVRAGAQ